MPFSGCFSSVARLLLCKRSLQTHPSDQITDDYTSIDQFQNDSKQLQHNQQVNLKVNVEASATVTTPTPGVVARLMGLDSLPPISRNGKANPLDSVTRSRSVNFMDYLLEFDLSQPHHRRVKTSVSFREVPTLLAPHNHSTSNNNSTNEFFLLYLDNIEKSKTKKVKAKKSGENNNKKEEKGEMVVRKERKISNNNNLKICKLKDEPRKQISRFGSCKGGGEEASSGFVSPRTRRVNRNRKGKCSVVKPINQKEVLVESKLMKKIKNQHAIKDLQSECSSEYSSPVSVLDLDDDHHQSPLLSSDCTTRRRNSNPEKKCQQKTTESEYLFTHASCLLNARDNDKKYYTEIVRELCKMAEEDLKESKWVTDENGLQFEICLDFGHQILDALVNQVVEELLGVQ